MFMRWRRNVEGNSDEELKAGAEGLQAGAHAKFHVFLSHAGEQKNGFVSVLEAHLKQEYPHLRYFSDEHSLNPAERAHEKILEAMRNSAVVVIVLSREFVCKLWPMEELRYFLREAKEGRVVCIPVLYKGFTYEDAGRLRQAYDEEHWGVAGSEKPGAAVLDTWAAQVKELLCITAVRANQVVAEEDALLSQRVVDRVVQQLRDHNCMPQYEAEGPVTLDPTAQHCLVDSSRWRRPVDRQITFPPGELQCQVLEVRYMNMLQSPDTVMLYLRRLDLYSCKAAEACSIPLGANNLRVVKLVDMELNGCLNQLESKEQLQFLQLDRCRGINNTFGSVDKWQHLHTLRIEYCADLTCLPDLSPLSKTLACFELWGSQVSELPGLDCLHRLQHLELGSVGNLAELPDLSKLASLEHLELWDLSRVSTLDGLTGVTSLTKLCIQHLPSMEAPPALEHLTNMLHMEHNGSIIKSDPVPGALGKDVASER